MDDGATGGTRSCSDGRRLFAVYLAGYFSDRFWIEGLRIDPAHESGGLRLNQWVSVAVVILSVMFLIIHRVRRGPISDDAATTQVQEFA